MTLSLAAVFIPLAFMPGLLGRIFREFAITIIVAILASGLVSLTLTPLMCSRILVERGAGPSPDLDGEVRQPVLQSDSRLLRPLARLVSRSWLARAADHRSPAPSAFGSSSTSSRSPFCRPATAASSADFSSSRKALRPISNGELQEKLDPILQANPAVDKYFTVAGTLRPGSRRVHRSFLKDAGKRAGHRYGHGRTAQSVQRNSGRFSDPQSAAGPANRYWRDRQLVRSLHLCPERDRPEGSLRRGRQARSKAARLRRIRQPAALRSFPQYAQPRHQHRARASRTLRRFHDPTRRASSGPLTRRTTFT